MTPTSPETLFQQAQALLSQEPRSIEALRLLQEAGRQQHAEAAFQVSRIMLEAEQPDITTIIPWLEIAAAQRHPYATFNLLRLREALGTPLDRHLTDYAWLAESGILPAQLQLLEYYANRNDPQAVYWAEHAAEQDHPFGHYFLAQYHHLCGQPDLERARRHYHQAAECGLGVAHWQLGQIYGYGIGTPIDTERAVHHLQQAAEQGFIAAQTLLAKLLAANGNSDALNWYRTAADQGDCDAQAALARHYLIGQITERDPILAAKYAKAAAAHAHPDAMLLLGDIYRYGLGLKADAHTALNHYRQAAEAGNIAAYQKLLSDAALYKPEQYQQAKEAALARQHIEATYQTALAHHQGRNRPINHTRARKHYLEAAEFHHPKAAFQLGMMTYYGQGIPADPKQAAYWFELAAEQGEAAAQYHLARMYYYGQGVSFNIPLACRWLEAAIRSGYENPEAFKHLLQQWQQELSS